MDAKGFARLAFEAHYNADHREGGWEAWTELTDDVERGKWLAVGTLMEEVTHKATLDAKRADEAEPEQPAKVIIVTEASGKERRYQAPDFGTLRDGTLLIGDKDADRMMTGIVAAYPPGHWSSVREDGAEADDVQAKALGITRSALSQILSVVRADAELGDSSDIAAYIHATNDTLFDLGYE